MSRKLVSIQRIKSIEPIEGADAIEKATILGWSCVVKKGELQEGSLCAYFEVDSMLPRTEWSEFLFKEDDKKDKFRLRTVRLRGQVSQGLALPLNILPLNTLPKDLLDRGLEEGTDITELLGVEKYEPEIPAQLQGQVKGGFPSFIFKTDETRIQAEPQVLDRYRGESFYITEKLDGSSMTVYLKNGEFGVCSRNMDLKETEGNTFWKVARELRIEENMRAGNGISDFAIQGELIGQGIQGNKYKLPNQTFKVFNIFDIDNGEYLNITEMMFCSALLGLETVPLLDFCFILHHNVEDLVKLSEGKSDLNPEVEREGIVIRPHEERRDVDLGRLSFKVINPKFLLKYKE